MVFFVYIYIALVIASGIFRLAKAIYDTIMIKRKSQIEDGCADAASDS